MQQEYSSVRKGKVSRYEGHLTTEGHSKWDGDQRRIPKQHQRVNFFASEYLTNNQMVEKQTSVRVLGEVRTK